MEEDKIWIKFEEACTAHSKMCCRLLVLATTLYISTVIADNPEAEKLLKKMNTFFFIGYFSLISGLVYSYMTYHERVNHWHYSFVYCGDANKIKDNKDKSNPFYKKFIIQTISLLVCYILLFVEVLKKYMEITDNTALCNLQWFVYGSIVIINIPWLYYIIRIILLLAIFFIEDILSDNLQS